MSQKITDYDIQLFSCIFFAFFFFFHQLKDYKQRKKNIFLCPWFKRGLQRPDPTLCIERGSAVQTDMFFENLLQQLHKRKRKFN